MGSLPVGPKESYSGLPDIYNWDSVKTLTILSKYERLGLHRDIFAEGNEISNHVSAVKLTKRGNKSLQLPRACPNIMPATVAEDRRSCEVLGEGFLRHHEVKRLPNVTQNSTAAFSLALISG